MKFTTEQPEFADALKTVARAIRGVSVIPALQNVYLRTPEGEDTLHVLASDSDVTLEMTLVAEVTVPGEITLPAKTLSEIVSALPNEPVIISVDEYATAQLRCKRSRHKIVGTPAQNYPTLPGPEGDKVRFYVREAWLHQAMRQLLVACSKDETKPQLTGVHFSFDPARRHNNLPTPLIALSCDTHRLAICYAREGSIEVSGTPSAFESTLPQRAAGELVKFLDPKSDHFAVVDVDSRQMFIETPTRRFSARLLAGDWPNYLKILPPAFISKWGVGKTELLQVLKRLEPIAREDLGRVFFQNDTRELLRCEAHNPSGGEAIEETDVTADGPRVMTLLNLAYLRDALAEMEGDSIWLHFNEATAPVLVRSAANPNHEVVLMPMAQTPDEGTQDDEE